MLRNGEFLFALKFDRFNGVDILDEFDNRLRFFYKQRDEDDLIYMIISIVDLLSDGYKLFLLYLLFMCIEYFGRYYIEL